MRASTYGILEDDHSVRSVRMEEWNKWSANRWRSGRRVALDKVDGVELSTVFLGINHGFNDMPLWFETMSFGLESYGRDEVCERYATWNEAVAGHAHLLDYVRKVLG